MMNNNDMNSNDQYQPEVSVADDSQKRKLIGLLFICIALFVLIFVIKSLFFGDKKPVEEANKSETNSISRPKSLNLPPEILTPEPKPAEPEVVQQSEQPKTPETKVETRVEYIREKPAEMVLESKPPVIKSASRSIITTPGGGGGIEQQEKGKFVDPFQNEKAVASVISAEKIELDSTFLLPKGTYIQCSLVTKIVSELAGDIMCTVSDDVYSENGHVLLIEKGSKVLGSYKSGRLKPGMNRLYVIWDEIRTPNKVLIRVSSPAVDTLGAAGVEGWVDNHWAQRFGAAILLSTIDDVLGALSHNVDKDPGYDYTKNSRESSQQMANTALEKMIDIEPTLYRNQGDLVGILVNKDVDFSTVYAIERK
jgi:type IV secretion system protein VirB10